MFRLRIITATYAGVRREALLTKAGQQDGDHLFLCVTLAGTSLVRRRAREIALSDGEAVLMTSEEPQWTIDSPAAVRIAGIRLQRTALARLVPNLDDAVMRPIPRDAGGLRWLRKYLEVVANDEALAAPVLQQLIVNHFYDLTALSLRPTCELHTLVETSSVRAARLATTKADIVANLNDGDLNVTTVASRNRVTVRYLHKLFESEGITFSEFVLGQRLARAHSILVNPLHSRRAISAIAFELGFNDLSYFNRTFRRRYHVTPSDVRSGLKAD